MYFYHKNLVLGSFRTASSQNFSIWHDTAKLVFNQTNDDDFVIKRGTYDKLIIDCEFRKNLKRKTQPSDNGGCNGFEPSITTSGLCYTFNGQHSSETWINSTMMSTFTQLFPSQNNSNKQYGGTRIVQGDIL